MKRWFESLAPRERVMVSLAAVVVVLAVFYSAVWGPLNKGVSRLSQQVQQQQQLAAWLNETAPRIRALRSAAHQRSPEDLNQALLTVIDKTSKAAGLGDRVKRIQPQGNESVQVWVEHVSFNDMLDWLYRLQNRYGVDIQSLSVEPGGQTGQVHGHMRLKRPQGSSS